MTSDAVVIEVGINEAAERRLCPGVPYAPAECADDARRCADAGAAVVHWHARDAETGAQRLDDAALYGEALDGMPRDRLVAYTSYPIEPESVDGRLGHCWSLRETHGLEVVPVDLTTLNVAIWNQAAGAFRLGGPGIVTNPMPFVLEALSKARDLGMVPALSSFELGATRTAGLLLEAGDVTAPAFLHLFVCGYWVAGPAPEPDAVDFHLRQLPDANDVEWVVVPYSIADPATVEHVCRRALELGGGIRVGVGDNPVAAAGRSNAELVEEAVRWAAEAGRPVATAADLRARLGVVAP